MIADLVKRRLRSKIPALTEALTGPFTALEAGDHETAYSLFNELLATPAGHPYP